MDEGMLELNRKLDALTTQMAYLTEQAQAAERLRQVGEDLVETATPVAKEALDLVAREMEDVQDYLDLKDLTRLLKKLARHSSKFEILLDLLDSGVDLVDVAGPIVHDGMDQATRLFTQAEDKGYWKLAQQSAQVGGAVLDGLVREDFTTIELNPSLFALMRQMQDPAVKRGLVATLRLLRLVGEQIQPTANSRG